MTFRHGAAPAIAIGEYARAFKPSPAAPILLCSAMSICRGGADMTYGVRKTCIFAAALGCLWANSAQADEHALICQSAAEAKELAQIVDRAPKPAKVGDVLGSMRSQGVKCPIVHGAVEYNDTVETVSLADDDYDIVQVTVNGRKFYSLKLQKGTRA